MVRIWPGGALATLRLCMGCPSFSRQIPECYLDEAMTASLICRRGRKTPPLQIRVYSRNLHPPVTCSLLHPSIRPSTRFINALEVLGSSSLISLLFTLETDTAAFRAQSPYGITWELRIVLQVCHSWRFRSSGPRFESPEAVL